MSKPSKLERMSARDADRTERRSAKREELARHALTTLSELSYANTSLRDVAEQSGHSVGLIHYYFTDKVDLITTGVRLYKAAFVRDLGKLVHDPGSPSDVRARFIEGLAQTILAEAHFHRLWYDIKAQALFDARFYEAVDDIEASLVTLIGELLQRIERPEADPVTVYVAVDGAFRFALQRHLRGDDAAADGLRQQMTSLLP